MSNKRNIDWDMLILCLLLLCTMWVDAPKVTEGGLEVGENSEPGVTEIIDLETLEEEEYSIPKYAVGNNREEDEIEWSLEVENIECPNCGYHIKQNIEE